MRSRWMPVVVLVADLIGMAEFGQSKALAQDNCCPPPRRQRLWCPPQCEAPVEKAPTKPDEKKPAPAPQPSVDLSLQSEQAAAFGGDTVALAAPNMVGNLLGTGNSITFSFQRLSGVPMPQTRISATGQIINGPPVQDRIFVQGAGPGGSIFPGIKVADNNSPIPQDRISFRYNFFNDAVRVTGDSGQSILDPASTAPGFGGQRFIGVTTSKAYDVHEFTFSGEKTFFDGRCSVELRVPFSHTLSHDLRLSEASATGLVPDSDSDSGLSVIQTTATPQNTLGSSDTEFGNLAVVLKGLVYQSERFALSVGASIGIPTARDSRIRVVDYLSEPFDSDFEVQRLRDIRVNNDTWALSPFVGALFMPTERFYTHGFLQFDCPLNPSTISYQEQALINTDPANLQLTPIAFRDRIRDQTLMQTDWGVGYWLVKQKDGWVNGIIPTLELHYTTTLDDAQIKRLPSAARNVALQPTGASGGFITEPSATVGNLRNRVDILDMTVGTTFVLGDRTTLATAVAFPLKTGDDRTFNWEFQLQLNYYFGSTRYRGWAPN